MLFINQCYLLINVIYALGLILMSFIGPDVIQRQQAEESVYYPALKLDSNIIY